MEKKRPPAVLIGWRMLCPRCADAKLYQSYLKPVALCPVCQLDYSRADAGDGAVPFVMMIAGLFGVLTGVTLMFWLGANLAVTALGASVVVMGLTLALLPRFKSILIVMQYRYKAGDESALRFRDED